MTTIGQRLHIVGDIQSTEDLLIEGRVEGSIHVPSAVLTISPQARVDADIRGKRIKIGGNVRGTIAASEHIELEASAAVSGTLSANHVVLTEGANFSGRIDMNQRTIAIKVAQSKAAQQKR